MASTTSFWLKLHSYTQRVKAVLRSRKAQDMAKAKFAHFKKVCKEVVAKKGAASRT